MAAAPCAIAASMIAIAVRRPAAHGNKCRAAAHAPRVILDAGDFAGVRRRSRSIVTSCSASAHCIFRFYVPCRPSDLITCQLLAREAHDHFRAQRNHGARCRAPARAPDRCPPAQPAGQAGRRLHHIAQRGARKRRHGHAPPASTTTEPLSRVSTGGATWKHAARQTCPMRRPASRNLSRHSR